MALHSCTTTNREADTLDNMNQVPISINRSRRKSVSLVTLVQLSVLASSLLGFAVLFQLYGSLNESLDWATAALPSPSVGSEGKFLPRVFAIYFPQFHPDPLNDRLWGANFTDWDNLRKAPAVNNKGFPIPRPLDSANLGYYDLRSKDTRKLQSQLASNYGVDGFIYHTYWFYDPAYEPDQPQPVLHAPLMAMKSDGYPNLPFFLNWCAVTWVNVWMGRPVFQDKDAPINKNKALTLQQQYFNATSDMVATHYRWLAQFFEMENYVKIRGEPVFFVYQYSSEMDHILEKLRQFAVEDGYPGLYIILGRGSPPEHLLDTNQITGYAAKKIQRLDSFPSGDLVNQTMTYPYPSDHLNNLTLPRWCQDAQQIPAFPQFGRNKPEIYGLPITFDNTPRREFKTANVWNYGDVDVVVDNFRKRLEVMLTFDSCCWKSSNTVSDRDRDNDERFVAINAWNEWAEGMSLEPSDVHEYRFLDTIREVKNKVLENQCRGPFLLGDHD